MSKNDASYIVYCATHRDRCKNPLASAVFCCALSRIYTPTPAPHIERIYIETPARGRRTCAHARMRVKNNSPHLSHGTPRLLKLTLDLPLSYLFALHQVFRVWITFPLPQIVSRLSLASDSVFLPLQPSLLLLHPSHLLRLPLYPLCPFSFHEEMNHL